MELYEDNQKKIEEPQDTEVMRFRQWFKEAVDGASDWREAAQEDYDFVTGQQWTDEEKRIFAETGRPTITVNRIKPLINVLSGYQRLNRYDIDFLPRTSDDIDICQVRKGMTKYVLDQSDYEQEESLAFLDASIGGLGWFSVEYRYDDERGDGEAQVKREDPFGIYVDPESHKPDFSDAKYVCRAKWADKDELKAIYPEHAEEIDAQYQVYDSAEKTDGRQVIDPLWFKRDTEKVRLVEVWYKEKAEKRLWELTDGSRIYTDELEPGQAMEMLLQGQIVMERTVKVNVVKMAVIMDTVLLEQMDSPYKHGYFPFVPLVCTYYGVGDLPAGFVRDLKDPQRELNKRRIQTLHILNTVGNGGGWIEDDAMTPDQQSEFEQKGSIPGHYTHVRPGAISSGKIMERGISAVPSGVMAAEQQATSDLSAISGINEALMGTDIPRESSGRAIALKQKQAVTHIAPMFDQLRATKKQIAILLWGKTGHQGIIPQFYTADKIYRIEGQNGQQFIHVNEQVIQQDPMGNPIVSTLNDLSHGDFDIVIADTQATTTARQAQMWGLIDAVQKLGIPGDMVFDLIIDLSDIPNKHDIKLRWQQRQEQQAQSAQQQLEAQMQLESIKNQDFRLNIAYKDAPLPIQFAMAAKAGMIDPQIAQYAINLMIQQMFPQLAAQMQQQAQQPQQQAQMPPEVAQALLQKMNPVQQQQAPRMTEPALQSLMDGVSPAL